jgi:hypothetical protein
MAKSSKGNIAVGFSDFQNPEIIRKSQIRRFFLRKETLNF